MTDTTIDPAPEPIDTGLPAPVHPNVEPLPMPLYDPSIVLDLVGWIALGVDRGYCSPASAVDHETYPDAPPSALVIDIEKV